MVGRREGARFEDLRTGRWLWNCHSNGGTFNLGHRNPDVIATLIDALADVDIGNHHLPSPHRSGAAEALAATTDGGLPGVVFSASASEANELAIKVARMQTGRSKIVVTDWCYHGTTTLTMAATVAMAERFGMSDDSVVSVAWNDTDAIRAAIDDSTAIVLLEAIPATVGFPIPEPGYLRSISSRCNEMGALLCIDEVQTGLGRTGHVWSYQHDDIEPDMVVTGKGLSGGIYPIAATLLNPTVFEVYSSLPRVHLSTFGGAELGSAVATKVCELITDPQLLHRVDRHAAMFHERLAAAGIEHRQRGLVMALRVKGQRHWRTWQKLLEHEVFAMPASFTSEWVQFKPPLILTDSDAGEIADRVVAALR